MDEDVKICPLSLNADSNGNMMYCVNGVPFWNYEFGMDLSKHNINHAIDECRAWDPASKTCKLIPEKTYNVLNLMNMGKPHETCQHQEKSINSK